LKFAGRHSRIRWKSSISQRMKRNKLNKKYYTKRQNNFDKNAEN